MKAITQKLIAGLLATVMGVCTASAQDSKSEASDSFESERKTGAFEVGYYAGSFSDVKATGSYGVGWTLLPWKIAPRLYVGLHLSPFNFNFGLVDSDYTSDVIRFGPAIGCYFTPKIFLAMPVMVNCDVMFDDKSNTKTSWGISAAPAVYLGSKKGLFVGPLFSAGFSGGSVETGFRAGFYF